MGTDNPTNESKVNSSSRADQLCLTDGADYVAVDWLSVVFV
jgi:hypothetical protein